MRYCIYFHLCDGILGLARGDDLAIGNEPESRYFRRTDFYEIFAVTRAANRLLYLFMR